MTSADSGPAARPSPEIVVRTVRTLPADTRRGLWLVLLAWAIVLALQVWDSSDMPGARGLAEFGSVALGTAGLLLLGLIQTLRRAESDDAAGSPAVRQILTALPPLGVVAGALHGATVATLIARVWLGTSLIVLAIAGVYAAALVVTVIVTRDASRRLYGFGQQEAARVAMTEAQLADARLAALRAQMHPHFLFNALSTVASLVATDPRAAEATVEHLSEVLRMTLSRPSGSMGTVEDEVEFVRAYLAVEQERFGGRLVIEWDVMPEARAARLPPLVIQPLVENAIKHGLAHRREGGRITVAVRVDAGRLLVAVTDTGDGFAPRHVECTGLGNLRQRLAAVFGPTAGLSISTPAAGGARVTLDVPFVRPAPEEPDHARPDR